MKRLGAGLAIVVVMLMANVARAETLTVFAAASLKTAFDTIAESFTQETGVDVVLSYAGTSALARQIEQGAPADVFASASDDWVTYLLERGALDQSSVHVFAGNTLVLIAPATSDLSAAFDAMSTDALRTALGEEGRLAVALVEAVPAGIYAREALQHLGHWQTLERRLAQTDNVRAALFLVALGEAPLGVVYGSDARAEQRVRVVAVLPPQSHSVIRYSAARVAQSAAPEAEQFLTFLLGDGAQAILQDQGFEPAP